MCSDVGEVEGGVMLCTVEHYDYIDSYKKLIFMYQHSDILEVINNNFMVNNI